MRPIQIVGGILVGLVFLGLFLRALRAALHGKAFHGVSHYGLNLGTYTTLAVVGAVFAISVIWLVKAVMTRKRR